jgi:uncharacterized protein (TIGR02186 family)
MMLSPAIVVLIGLASPPKIHVEPSTIEIGMFYGGTTLSVDATLEGGGDVVVICRGKPGAIELKQKGKVWGLLWMNVGEVSFESVPSVYLLASTAALSQLAPAGELRELGVGYQAVGDAAGGATDAAETFSGLVALKESDGLFVALEGGVHVESVGEHVVHATAQLFFPAKAPPGEYVVEVFRFSAGHGVRVGSTVVKVRRVGTAALIASLAHQHGLLYGVVAVVIALVVGLLTGLVFGLGSKGGH